MESNKNSKKGTFQQWYFYSAVETLRKYIGRREKIRRVSFEKVCLKWGR